MSISSKISTWLYQLTCPPDGESIDELRFWQERIIYSFLFVAIGFGLVVLVPSIILAVKEQLWVVVGIDASMYVFVVVLFLRRSWPFIVRVVSVILLSYILGTLLLVVIGPFGAGPVWLFFFPVITGLLLEFRYAIASLVVNTLTLIFFGWLFSTHFDNWSASNMNPLESWIVIGLNFLLLNIIATISIVMVVRGLEVS
jgi:hypothetical protein